MKAHNIMHSDLIISQEQAYKPSELLINNFMREKESQEYAASTFTINSLSISFRVAKITPTKTGQFVTFWKRIGSGPIMPYDLSDPFDLLVISVRKEKLLGQFVFPKSILHEKGLLSNRNGRKGKRAMRIYPLWDITESKQAQKAQAWQLKYFFEIPPTNSINLTYIKRLFQ